MTDTVAAGWGLKWLDIPKRMGDKPKGTVDLELWRFAALAGECASHPRDMQRFYQFIVRAHVLRSRLSHIDVRARLVLYGFQDAIAEQLAEAYWHGRCSLASRRFTGNFARWLDKDARGLF
jgi:hypothetical protein